MYRWPTIQDLMPDSVLQGGGNRRGTADKVGISHGLRDISKTAVAPFSAFSFCFYGGQQMGTAAHVHVRSRARKP